jgi:hypothetical protein
MAIRSELVIDGVNTPITIHICNININQPIDNNNRPNSMPRAGIIRMTVTRVSLHSLREWAVDPNMRKGGEIRYINDAGRTTTSVLFYDAYCIDYTERFNSTSSETLTVDLVISAHRILFGGTLRVTNAWPGIVAPSDASADAGSANFDSSSSASTSSSSSSSSSDDGAIVHPTEI